MIYSFDYRNWEAQAALTISRPEDITLRDSSSKFIDEDFESDQHQISFSDIELGRGSFSGSSINRSSIIETARNDNLSVTDAGSSSFIGHSNLLDLPDKPFAGEQDDYYNPAGDDFGQDDHFGAVDISVAGNISAMSDDLGGAFNPLDISIQSARPSTAAEEVVLPPSTPSHGATSGTKIK